PRDFSLHLCSLSSSLLLASSYTPTTDIYTLSLHDALPISHYAAIILPLAMFLCALAWHTAAPPGAPWGRRIAMLIDRRFVLCGLDRKSTRLNSSHLGISYAVFCLKKKKIDKRQHDMADDEQ